VRAWAAHESIVAETVKGYLFTIARNLFLQGLRSKVRQSELSRDVPDSAPSAYQQVEQKAEVNVSWRPCKNCRKSTARR